MTPAWLDRLREQVPEVAEDVESLAAWLAGVGHEVSEWVAVEWTTVLLALELAHAYDSASDQWPSTRVGGIYVPVPTQGDEYTHAYLMWVPWPPPGEAAPESLQEAAGQIAALKGEVARLRRERDDLRSAAQDVTRLCSLVED